MYEYKVIEITKVVDGDTVDVLIDLGFGVSYHQRVRLAGIDAPESRTRNLQEKKLGLESKEYLKHRIESCNSVVIKTEKDDTGKFGRILGWLFLDGDPESINHEMIRSGYAWVYGGGTKEKDLNLLLATRSVS